MRFFAAVIMLTLLCASPMLGQSDSSGCALNVEISADGPLFNYITGKPYKLTLKLVNPTQEEVKLESFEVAAKSDKNLAIDVKADGDAPKSVAAGQEAVASYTITFPEAAGNKIMTLTGAAKCFVVGTVKSELQILITPQIELTMLPSRMILAPSNESNRVGVSVINHLDNEFAGKVSVTASPGLKVSPAENEIKIDSYGLEAFLFEVKPESNLVPGHYAAYIDVAGKSKDWVAIDAPVLAKRSVGNIAVNGKLNDWNGAASVAIARLVDGAKWETIGKCRFTWYDSNLRLAIEVDDANHFINTDSQSRTKANPPSDTIVIGFDPLIDGAKDLSGGYRDDDCEITLCGAEAGSAALLTWAGGKSQETETKIPVAFTRNGAKSCYEVAIPWSEIKSFKPGKDAKFAMSILVNDSDGTTVTQTEWGGGLAGQVDPRKFLPVVLQ
ncbi:MAG: sugar-binding protein [Armatimonadota bacterium]